MNDDFIVTVYVIVDETMRALEHRSHPLARVSDAEVLTVAVVAAKYFANNQERALQVMRLGRYLAGPLSASRFNRRLHALADWLELILATLGELFARGEAYLLDSMPGRAYCGYCAAKKEKFFGWRLHLLCTAGGVPVAFDVVPGRHHDLTPVHELAYGLPAGAAVYADKAYNSAADEASILADTDVRLVPIRKANMRPNDWADTLALRAYRRRIETVNSQLAAMGIQQLHVRTNQGRALKIQAALLAVTCTNAA